MNELTRALLGTLLTWAGYAALLQSIYVLLRSRNAIQQLRSGRGPIFTLLFAGLAIFVGGRFAGVHAFDVPLVWVVMPFAGWGVLVSAIGLVVRAAQALGSLNPTEKRARIMAAAVWAGALVVLIFWYMRDEQAEVRIIKGAIPMSGQTAGSLLILAVVAMAVMGWAGREARARGIAKGIATHLTLIAGSMLFGLPLVWLTITSFKEEIDMSSPNGIVWVPRVQETVPYFSKANPLYSTVVDGAEVQGPIIEERADGTVKLDINKPVSLRGTTLETKVERLKEVPRDAPLVTVQMDGRSVKGMVVESLADGHLRVEAVEPAELKGREQVYEPAAVAPIRKIGLRTANYSDALDYLPVEANKGLTYLKNTLLIVVFALIGTVLSSALVAYAFSRMRFPGRDFLFSLMLATMMLPGAVTKLPQFMIFRQLGWIDTLYPLWVPAFFGSAFNIFMLRQFFKQIPMELEDAAKIDGANYLRTFWSVMLPLIKPAIAVIAILTFVGTWNSFLDPLIYLSSPENMTISYAVQLYAADRAGEPGLLAAFTMMSMLPVLALFFLAQRYFIEGVTLTGMGGR